MRAAVATLSVFATLWFAFGLHAAGWHLWLPCALAVLLSVALFLGVPVAYYLPYSPYYAAAAAMVCVAAAAFAIEFAGLGDRTSQLTVGLGSAFVLWLTSAAIVRTARLRAAISSRSQDGFR